MKIVKLHKDIFIAQGVVSKKIFDDLLEYSKTITEEEWYLSPAASYDIENFWVGRAFSPYSRKEDPYKHLYVGQLFKINYKVSNMFRSYSVFEQFGLFQRSTDKNPEGMKVHADNGHESHSDIRYGLVMYLNDDFSGGKLYYPDLDITYSPKAGDIVIHEGSIPHGTTEVEVGNRYIMTTFIHGNEDTKFLLGDNNK